MCYFFLLTELGVYRYASESCAPRKGVGGATLPWPRIAAALPEAAKHCANLLRVGSHPMSDVIGPAVQTAICMSVGPATGVSSESCRAPRGSPAGSADPTSCQSVLPAAPPPYAARSLLRGPSRPEAGSPFCSAPAAVCMSMTPDTGVSSESCRARRGPSPPIARPAPPAQWRGWRARMNGSVVPVIPEIGKVPAAPPASAPRASCRPRAVKRTLTAYCRILRWWTASNARAFDQVMFYYRFY